MEVKMEFRLKPEQEFQIASLPIRLAGVRKEELIAIIQGALKDHYRQEARHKEIFAKSIGLNL